MAIKEAQLRKALSEMEAIAKGGQGKLPKTTAEANGGLSDEGDKEELAAKGHGEDDDDFDGEDAEEVVVAKGDKAKAKKKKGLVEWAKEEESEEAHKGGDMEDESESADAEAEDESEDKAYKAKKAAKAKGMKKSSIADLMKSDSSSGAIIDVEPFLEKLVDQVSEAEMALRKSVQSQRAEQQAFNMALSKSVNIIGQGLLALQKQLANIGDLPVQSGRKSVVSKSEVNERFGNELGGDDGFDFSKSQVLDAMVVLAQHGKINPIDVSRYEVTSTMEPNVAKAVEDHLRKSA